MRREPSLWPAVAVAAALFGLSLFVLEHSLERGLLSDVPVYRGYADLMRAGQVPYRDFAVEYPPAALPAFLLPSYLPWSYPVSFAVTMGVCGAACLGAAASVLAAVGAGAARSTAALLLIGFSPLALGGLFDTRFDLWPALLAVAALAAAVRERPLWSGALGGLAVAAKLWPFALVPIAIAYLWRRRGSRAAAAAAAAFLVAAAACFLPFAAIAPGGVRHSLTGQLDRPLQIESLGAAVLMAAEHLGAAARPTVTSHGGQAFTGSLPDAVAALSTAVEALAVVGVWLAFARLRRPSREAAVVASAAAVATLLAFGKVFSPQFLIWLVPFAPLVRGRRGLAASGLLVAALGLTQTWFPGDYWRLALDHASPWVWYLLVRDVAVVALAAVLAWPRGRDHAAGDGQRARLAALESLRGGP